MPAAAECFGSSGGDGVAGGEGGRRATGGSDPRREVPVSDAASVLDLPKEKQREAVARVRSGDARTVRQAAKQLAGPPLDEQAKPALRARELRRGCQRFTAGYERLFREIENAAWACGANEHTRRAHEALTAAQCAMQA